MTEFDDFKDEMNKKSFKEKISKYLDNSYLVMGYIFYLKYFIIICAALAQISKENESYGSIIFLTLLSLVGFTLAFFLLIFIGYSIYNSLYEYDDDNETFNDFTKCGGMSYVFFLSLTLLLYVMKIVGNYSLMFYENLF